MQINKNSNRVPETPGFHLTMAESREEKIKTRAEIQEALKHYTGRIQRLCVTDETPVEDSITAKQTKQRRSGWTRKQIIK